ncbi:MAG: magnesium-translocating P-type ATPase [Anaerofustis sp.]
MNLNQMDHNLHQSVRNSETEDHFQRWSALSPKALLDLLQSSPNGLSDAQAKKRIAIYGENVAADKKSRHWYHFLFRAMTDEFILVLMILSVVSFFLRDRAGAGIILLLALISAVIRFLHAYRSELQTRRLSGMFGYVASVIRSGKEEKIQTKQLVPGDIVTLNAGSIIPADLILLQAKDLFVSQSVFTGESIPVEKKTTVSEPNRLSIHLENVLLMGSSVISGSGVGVAVNTGGHTYLGLMAKELSETREKTNFETGLAKVTATLVKYMIVIVCAVFVINLVMHKDLIDSLMFSISVAVGLTPGMLPMIVNATLAKGASFLAKKNTIVKDINAIQNLGAIDVLCTDKTGTLTQDRIVLNRYIDIDGGDDIRILDDAYLNSCFSTGMKNLIDRAIISFADKQGLSEIKSHYEKVDEIPFDAQRRKLSVVLKDDRGGYRMITKGALEETLAVCSCAKIGERMIPIDSQLQRKITSHADDLNAEGMHVIAIAVKTEYSGESVFTSKDEADMLFVGYIAFLDPPKRDAAKAISALNRSGVSVKVLSGDAPLVTRHICQMVGINEDAVLTGDQIEGLSENELGAAVETNSVFARLSPMQKMRVVRALRMNGHVVGFLGDGVNDAPALRTADVGICVNTAADIAKESSEIILLKKSLSVLHDGILEGRRIYGNIMKYMKMALSSNFGNVFSVLVASLFLPFLPMLPIQILLQNLIYDLSQVAIPWDRVDPEFLVRPKRWDIKGLTRFMNTLGGVSSFYDLATYAVLWFMLGYHSVAMQAYFQTGWFMEGLISQTLIIHFIRTSKIPFLQSRADIRLLLSTFGAVLLAVGVPFFFLSVKSFDFRIMSGAYYFWLAGILICYAITVEFVKKWYIRRFGEWL